MNTITTICIVLSLRCMVNAQRQCTAGTQCKSIYDCPPLLVKVRNPDRSKQDVASLRQAHCGFEGETPTVCCPSSITQVIQPEPAPTDQCYTPEGKVGKCVNLHSCPALFKLLQHPAPSDKITYVQNSKCISPDQYSVCCGPVPDFNQVPRGRCENNLSAFPPDPRSECCGVDARAGNKIFGGLPTAVDQYPWLALIRYKLDTSFRTLCGGALISNKYVLTAAHCVYGQILSVGTPFDVVLAEYNTDHEGPDCAPVEAGGVDCTDGLVTIPIDKLIPHPQYNVDSRNRNDIALVRMTEMAPFTDFIRPICLPNVDMTLLTTPFNLTTAGWGAISEKQRTSPIKLHVELPYVSIEKCQPSYSVPGRNVQLWKGQICAGGEKGKDSCKGDSGGPLMYENGRTYEIIGVVSFGPLPCGIVSIPGVYTNVYEYNTWIRSNIAP